MVLRVCVFTARCHASALLDKAMCLSVSLSVCQKPELCRVELVLM